MKEYNYFKEELSEKSYHVESFMAFRANEVGHDYNHAILCDNSPILGICVHLGLTNNVAEGIFQHVYKKNYQENWNI